MECGRGKGVLTLTVALTIRLSCFTGFEYDFAITLTDLSRFLATARSRNGRAHRVNERAWRAEIGTA